MKPWVRITALAMLVGAGSAAAAESGRVALTRLSLGEIGGWIELAVTVNAQPGRWLLDTGSTRNLVSAAFAQRHALDGGAAVHADTALGPLQGTEVMLPALGVGTLQRSGQTALQVDLRTLVGPAAEGLDGILGAPFLHGLEVDLDLHDWVLEARDSPAAPGTCPVGLQALPLGRHRGLPVLTVVVNDGPAEALLLDTGNPGALVRLTADDPGAAGPGLALPGGARLATARQVQVGALVRSQVPVVHLRAAALKRALGPRIGGLAGTALLDGARWQLDLAHDRACAPVGPLALPGGFGLTLAQRDATLVIETVLPGGPAQAAGLRAGDVVQRWVDGAASGTLRALWARVQGRDEITLQVRSDAGDPREVREVRLRRAYFAPVLP